MPNVTVTGLPWTAGTKRNKSLRPLHAAIRTTVAEVEAVGVTPEEVEPQAHGNLFTDDVGLVRKVSVRIDDLFPERTVDGQTFKRNNEVCSTVAEALAIAVYEWARTHLGTQAFVEVIVCTNPPGGYGRAVENEDSWSARNSS